MTRRVVYLHGFASSPRSRKAQFFAEKLREIGFEVAVPELADEGFEQLSLSGQLRVVEHAADGQACIVIGSSMGGYLAALYAARHAEVEKLVLLAPAFDFANRWQQRIGDKAMQQWKESGALSVYHYGEGREASVGWQLMEDALHYEAYPKVNQPTLIFHGTKDEVVRYEVSDEFARRNPNVEVRLKDSGHELTDVMDEMWTEMQSYFSSFSVTVPM